MKKKVLIASNFVSVSGGIRHACEDLADKLEQRGWSVVRTSAKVNRLPRMLDIVGTIWQKRSLFSVAQVDVYSGLAFALAELICANLRLLGKPYVLTLRGGYLPMFAKKHPARVRRLLQSAKVVTVPSVFLLEDMQDYCSNMVVIPNPLDVGKYKFRLRNRLSPVLIWVRSLHKIYNPVLAVRVLNLLLKEYPGTYLYMAGPDKADGSYQQVMQEATDLNILGHLELTGTISKSNIPALLDKGDIFINTTNIDNTPVSVMEAMACGLCVVTTNVGGLPYLLEDGVDALLVPPDDSQAMANAIRRLLTEPGLAEKLSTNARRKVEGFDWSIILPQWERLFAELTQDA